MKGWARGTYWGEYNLKGRPSLEVPGLGGRMVLEWRGMEWIHLAPNRVKWWAVTNMVMNVQVETIIQYRRKSAALRFKPDSTVQEKHISQDSLLAVWLNVLGTQIILLMLRVFVQI